MLKKLLIVLALALSVIGMSAGFASASSRYYFTGNHMQVGHNRTAKYNIYTENGGVFWSRLILTKSGHYYLPEFEVANITQGRWDYPNIGQGDERGMRPAGSWKPVRAVSSGRIISRFSASVPHRGTWNEGYDVWVTKSNDPWLGARGHASQSQGTEIMILVNGRNNSRFGYNSPGKYRGIVRVGGVRWRIYDGAAHNHSGHWNRIYFVATRPLSWGQIWINPFMTKSARLGMTNLRWYVSGIDFGIEVHYGGTGYSLNSYSLNGVR